MKLLRFAAAAAALPWLAGATFGQQDLNRVQLDNGGDILWFINDPYVGSDPGNGNFGGDYYWKVFPGAALQRCSGADTLWGVQFSLFDDDWTDGSVLWSYLIQGATSGTDLVLAPVLDVTAPGVLVPIALNSGFGAPGGGDCPPPGYVSGWIITETFFDTDGNAVPLLQATDPAAGDYFACDGSVDWTFTHFYPGNAESTAGVGGGQSPTQPNPNACGGAGSSTFQWLGSTDGVGPFGDGGENAGPMSQTNDGNPFSGLTVPGDRSIYCGLQAGGVTPSGSIPESQDGGAELAWFTQGMQLNLAVDTRYPVVGVIAPQTSTAGLSTPFGWDTSTGAPAVTPGGGFMTTGGIMYNQSADSNGLSFGALGLNIIPDGPFLPVDASACLTILGADFGLGFAEPFFTVFNTTAGLGGGFASAGGETSYTSPNFPLGFLTTAAAFPLLLGFDCAWQGWEYDASAGLFVESSNVIRQAIRPNTNVQ